MLIDKSKIYNGPQKTNNNISSLFSSRVLIQSKLNKNKSEECRKDQCSAD